MASVLGSPVDSTALIEALPPRFTAGIACICANSVKNFFAAGPPEQISKDLFHAVQLAISYSHGQRLSRKIKRHGWRDITIAKSVLLSAKEATNELLRCELEQSANLEESSPTLLSAQSATCAAQTVVDCLCDNTPKAVTEVHNSVFHAAEAAWSHSKSQRFEGTKADALELMSPVYEPIIERAMEMSATKYVNYDKLSIPNDLEIEKPVDFEKVIDNYESQPKRIQQLGASQEQSTESRLELHPEQQGFNFQADRSHPGLALANRSLRNALIDMPDRSLWDILIAFGSVCDITGRSARSHRQRIQDFLLSDNDRSSVRESLPLRFPPLSEYLTKSIILLSNDPAYADKRDV